MEETARISPDELLEHYHAERRAGETHGHELNTHQDDALACSCGEWSSDSPSAYKGWLEHLTDSGVTIDYS